MAEWTPEPWIKSGWRILGGASVVAAETDVERLATLTRHANAERIVECVNALAGRDPSKLAALEAAVEVLLDHVQSDRVVRCDYIHESEAHASVCPGCRVYAALKAFRGEMREGRHE